MPVVYHGVMQPGLDRATILLALRRLSDLLRERGVQGEICLFGGTAMVLAFNARERTKDIDAVFEPPQLIRELAIAVQEELQLPAGWLNDAVKGFLAPALKPLEHDLPQFENLRVTAPPAEYLLAMKCMAARIASAAEAGGDVEDIRFLLRHLGLGSAEEALAVVARYYPKSRVPARTQYLLEELFEEPEGRS
jgi:hypothetical protein